MSSTINRSFVCAEFHSLPQKTTTLTTFHQDKFVEALLLVIILSMPVLGKRFEHPFALQVAMFSGKFDNEVANDVEAGWSCATAPSLQPRVENKQVSTLKIFEALFWRCGVSVRERVELRIEMHERIRHSLLEPIWKILNRAMHLIPLTPLLGVCSAN